MDNNSVGIGDAMLLANQNNGGWWMWIILLFFLIGGNGGWNNRDSNVARIQDVYASNDNQSLRTAVNSLGNGIADATFALNGNIMGGFCNTQRDIMQGNFAIEKGLTDNRYVLGNAINEGRFAQQQCCCETNRNIDGVRYDGAMNTAAITTNATCNTQKILDKLCSMEANAKDAEIAALRQQLSAAHLAVSQQAQNAQLISAIRPYPAPAYVVSSPYGGACPCAAV